MLAGVVSAEEQLAARLELHAKVGLRAAPVATVHGGQRGTRGNCCGHIGLFSH